MPLEPDVVCSKVDVMLAGGDILPLLHNGFPALRVGGAVLVIECAWRILREGVVVVGTGFADADKSNALEALVASPFRSVEVLAPHLELVLTFDGGRLETIADAEHCWWFDRDRQRVFTVGPGWAREGE